MATNEILKFCETDTSTNLLSQVDYTSDPQRLIGNQPGVARAQLVNKVLRQTSLMSASVAQYLYDNNISVLDTDSSATIATNINSAINAQVSAGFVSLTASQSLGGVKTFTSFPVTPSSAPTTDYQAANKKYVDDSANAIATTSGSTGVRQTVQYASVDSSGAANFMSAGTGLSVNIAASSTNIVIHSAGGKKSLDRIGVISADTSVAGLTNATTNYIYATIGTNGSVTLGSTTLAPIYQFAGAASITNGQFTFNIAQMTGFVGNGSTSSQAYQVFLGEAIAAGGVITSAISYALNGIYSSDWFNVVPLTLYTKNHNLGTIEFTQSIEYKVATADAAFAVGDIAELSYATLASNTSVTSAQKTKNAYSIRTYQNTFVAMSPSLTTILKSDGAYRMFIKRKF